MLYVIVARGSQESDLIALRDALQTGQPNDVLPALPMSRNPGWTDLYSYEPDTKKRWFHAIQEPITSERLGRIIADLNVSMQEYDHAHAQQE